MNNRERQDLDRHITGNGGEDQYIDGDYRRCAHCEGTGQQQGPGGKEPCCRCRGEGEVWLDAADIMDDGDGA